MKFNYNTSNSLNLRKSFRMTFKFLFFFTLCIYGQNISSQCTSFSGNLGGNNVSSSEPNFSVLTYCNITNGAWIGGGAGNGSATWTIPGGTNSIAIDFTALSFVPTDQEYLQVEINGEFVDLNNGDVTFVSGFPGCSSSATASITTASDPGYAGKSGVIITDADDANGTVVINFDCTVNTITLRNVKVIGNPNGTINQIRYCTNAPMGVACTDLGDAPCDLLDADAPTLSASTLSNVCPATTADLTSITASNTPAGTSLTWHTATPATTANLVANSTMVEAGTYYAAFYDATNDCYSNSGDGTTPVTVTINTCVTCNAGDAAPILIKN